MGLRFRKRLSLGPLRFNFTRRGLSSVSLKAGPFTWNPRRDRLTTNLPGGLYYEADLRPTHCRTDGCGHPALAHGNAQGCTVSGCPCTQYRRAR
jgi:hypothetical protein